MEKSNENTIRQGVWGAIAISFAAVLWGLDGIVLTPRLYNLDVGFVVMVLHLIPFLLMTLFCPINTGISRYCGGRSGYLYSW